MTTIRVRNPDGGMGLWDAFAYEGGTEPHAYFQALAALPNALAVWALRSQAELDTLRDYAHSPKKQPITYDAIVDAALARIYAPISTDSQQKRLPFAPPVESLFLTWDFRHDPNCRYRAVGDLSRHKAYVIGPGSEGHWMAFKTDYRNATKAASGVAELFMSMQSRQWLGPGTTRGGQEILEPRLGKFYIQPDTWTRVAFFVDGIGQPVSAVSVWVSDEQRNPVQLYDRLQVVFPSAASYRVWLEYDSAKDTALNPVEMRIWNRNLVALQQVVPAAVPPLLQRPM